MAFLHIPRVNITGVSACVPETRVENINYKGFHPEEVNNVIAAIGVEERRVADENICASDLCYHAAEKLINDLGWKKSDIDCLIFVTQTPDYILPATSGILQDRLKLDEEIFVLDVSLGCSGWIYGLQVAASLLSHGYMKKGLLLAGDTQLKFTSVDDKSTFPLFGDAGTATALEFDEKSDGFRFHTATDGTGYDAIIIPDGGYRNPVSLSSFEPVEISPGIKRNRMQVILDGMNVFSFSISRAPESINKLSERFSIELQDIDYFVFHQANLFMNERIRRKLHIPPEKVPYSLKHYGNTGPATIPLTMVTELGRSLSDGRKNILACGFGVGLSWGSVQFFTDNIVCSEIIEI